MSDQHSPQALESLFFATLDALRGVWDANNASSALFSLVFLKRLLALHEEGALPWLRILPSDVQWSEDFKQEAVNDISLAVQQLIHTVTTLSKRNPLMGNIFAPLVLALEEEPNPQLLLQAVLVLEELDFSNAAISIEVFGQFFNNSLYKTAWRAGKNGIKRTTPKTLNRLLVALADCQPGEVVYDPVAGQGSTLVGLHQYCPDIRLVGQEQNIHIWALCKMNLWANGAYRADLIHTNALVETAPFEPQADIAIGHFPFGQSIPSTLVKEQSYTLMPFDLNLPQIAGNSLFVQLLLSKVSTTGRVVTLLPIQALHDEREDRRLREWLVRRDWVEAVITLPYGLLFTTGIPICILVLNKNKPHPKKDKILFINGANLPVRHQSKLQRRLAPEQIDAIAAALHKQQASDMPELDACISQVATEHVIQNDYNLDAKRYASPFLERLRQLDARGGLIQLKQIFHSERPALWFDETPHQDLPYIRPDDLSPSIANYLLDVHQVSTSNEVRRVAGRLINESVLLVNRSGNWFRASYFRFREKPILVNEDIMTFRIDEDKVLIEYLLLQLRDSLFLQQLNMYKTEDQNRSIHEEQFELLQISLPPLDEQAQIIRETKLRLLQEEERKVERLRQDLNLGKQRAQNEQHKIISSLQHELGNRLPAVLTELKNLKDFLKDKESDGNPVHFSDPIFPVFPGEDVNSIDSLETVLERAESILIHSINSLSSTSAIIQADRSKLRLEQVKVRDFLEEVQQLYAQDNRFQIYIEVEEDERGRELPIYTRLDKTQMTTVFTNLIDNAKRHGFQHARKQYTIQFTVGLSADQQEVIILYKNDGLPFPSNFSFEDFIGYGNYAGHTGHSGIGGYLIHQIIDNHNGHLAYRKTMDPHDPFNVQFELTLPVL